VGPNDRAVNRASARYRFVLWLDVTLIISVNVEVLPARTANRRNPMCRDRAKYAKMTQVVVVQQLTQIPSQVRRPLSVTDLLRLTARPIHFDRIRPCFRKRSRFTGTACGDAILRIVSKTHTRLNASSKMLVFARH